MDAVSHCSYLSSPPKRNAATRKTHVTILQGERHYGHN
jgi:hypothetical protein